MRKKFDVQAAIMTMGVATLSGVVTGFVQEKVDEQLPDQPELAAFIPVGIGAFLSQQKDKNLQTAGIAMMGAGGSKLLSAFGVELLGQPGAKTRGKLSPAQQAKMLQKAREISAKNGLKVAGPGSYTAEELANVLAGVKS